MNERVAFLFPGQGAQAVGMGRELCSQFPRARALFAEADEVLRQPLSRLCFEGPLAELTLTANTQPALLTVSSALSGVLQTDFGVRPSWVAGHSLGEFSALVAAEVLTFADALRLVRERGLAMQEAVPPAVGSMAAIFGLDPATIAAICTEAADGQVVIAGHQQAVERAVALARGRGAKHAVPLAVSAPFHCALMQPAALRLATALEPLAIREPTCPVISNVDARPYAGAGAVKELLVRQVTSPVRWQESVEELDRHGCRRAIEVGPGRVLSGLVKRIAPGIRCISGEDLDAVRKLDAA